MNSVLPSLCLCIGEGPSTGWKPRDLAHRFGVLRKVNSDLPSLLDEWAGSLFRELDYRKEAVNGTKFKELYAHLEVGFLPFSSCPLSTEDKGFLPSRGESRSSTHCGSLSIQRH